MSFSIRVLTTLVLLAFGSVLHAQEISRTTNVAKAHNPRYFPNLGSSYVVLAPATPSYNCIAHAVGVNDRWIWPGSSVGDFDRLFGQYGYQRTAGMNLRVQPRVDKIVLYAKVQSGSVEMTHAARQSPSGGWTSKLGKGPLIAHSTPYALSGPAYGGPYATYIRRR